MVPAVHFPGPDAVAVQAQHRSGGPLGRQHSAADGAAGGRRHRSIDHFADDRLIGQKRIERDVGQGLVVRPGKEQTGLEKRKHEAQSNVGEPPDSQHPPVPSTSAGGGSIHGCNVADRGVARPPGPFVLGRSSSPIHARPSRPSYGLDMLPIARYAFDDPAVAKIRTGRIVVSDGQVDHVQRHALPHAASISTVLCIAAGWRPTGDVAWPRLPRPALRRRLPDARLVADRPRGSLPQHRGGGGRAGRPGPASSSGRHRRPRFQRLDLRSAAASTRLATPPAALVRSPLDPPLLRRLPAPGRRPLYLHVVATDSLRLTAPAPTPPLAVNRR